MKKIRHIIVLFAMLFSSWSHAQNTFAPIGAEWWYSGDCYSYDYWCDMGYSWGKWTDHLQSIKDTLLLGKPARVLAATRYYRRVNSNINVGKRDTFFVYNNDDTTFVYDKATGDFTALYIFNVAVGDTVCLHKPNTSSEFCIIIDSIKLEAYGNEQLRSYYNHTIIDNDSLLSINWGVSRYFPDEPWGHQWKNIGKYTEKIGGNWPYSGSFFPEVSIQNPDYYKVIGFPTGTLRCYSDSATDVKMTTEACDTVIPVSILGVSQSPYSISIFPNPSTGMFMLTIGEPLTETLDIQIADLSGRVVLVSQLPKGIITHLKLDLEHLKPGVYLLLLRTKEQRYYQKLVISH